MANTNQARKRARQADARRDHASGQKSALRKEIKKFRTSLTPSSTRSDLSSVQAHIARAAQKQLIPKHRADRMIQRLNAALKRVIAA